MPGGKGEWQRGKLGVWRALPAWFCADLRVLASQKSRDAPGAGVSLGGAGWRRGIEPKTRNIWVFRGPARRLAAGRSSFGRSGGFWVSLLVVDFDFSVFPPILASPLRA